MAILNSKFDIGEIVYLMTDEAQSPGIITTIKFHPGPTVSYTINFGTLQSEHYEFELSSKKNIELQLGLKAIK